MNFDDALDELNTILGDSNDVTFTSSEKERALTKAWNDAFVVEPVWDSSKTYTSGTYQYALPDDLMVIKEIYISPAGDTSPFPDPLDSSLWEVVAGNIQFRPMADNIIPNGYKLYLKGSLKLTVDDPIETANLQEYVLSLAGVDTLKLLAFKKANLFLKNDTSMAELIALRRELQADVVDGRRKLQKEWESA